MLMKAKILRTQQIEIVFIFPSIIECEQRSQVMDLWTLSNFSLLKIKNW